MHPPFRLLLNLAPFVLAAIALPGFATTPATGTAATSAAADAAIGQHPVAATFGTITVIGNRFMDYRVTGATTATRTETPVINIPQTLQAIPHSLLRDQNAQSLSDALRNAPGVSLHQGEGNRDEAMIRGVKTKADFFINGMRDDTEYFRDLYNVQEVDVLQGPAAVLFGRGNAGGLINLVIKKAIPTPIHSATLELGSWQHRRATIDWGGALGSTGAYRINVMGERSASYRDYGFLHRYAINPEFSFRAGENTQLDVGIEHLYDNRHADRGIPSYHGRPADVDANTFFGSVTQNTADATVDAVHVRFAHAFSDALTLRDQFRYSRTDKFYQNLFPGSALADDGALTLAGYNHGNTRDTYANRTELVYDLHTGRVSHRLLFGTELLFQADDDIADSAAPVVVSVNNPIADTTFTSSRNSHVVGHSLGVYAQDQVTFSEHWLAMAGLRWDRFSVNATMHLSGQAARHVDTHWSPRAGLIYKPTPNQSIYASVTKTFTPQGSNLGISMKSLNGADLAPQTAVNYEIGDKTDLTDNLSLSIAAFQLDLDHVKAHDPHRPGVIVQTGAQRTRGASISLTGSLTTNWKLYAGYARLNATIHKTTTKAPAGNKIGLVPNNQFSLWTSYAITRHWGIGGGWVGRSREYTQYTNTVILPGYVRTDLMAYYETDRFRLALNIKNALDVNYYPTANGDNQITPGAPLSAQLTFSARF